MKKLPKIVLEKGGKPAFEERRFVNEDGSTTSERHPLTTGYLIRVAIENSTYSKPKDQHDAFKIYEKIDEDDDPVELEDAEFELIDRLCSTYAPYLNGIMWVPFHQVFDEARKK